MNAESPDTWPVPETKNKITGAGLGAFRDDIGVQQEA
jgi:hypothetical protein